MDFTHKFGSGPMPTEKLISEYFNPGKMRRSGNQNALVGKRYSNPPFSFREQDFLNKFKYLYAIGREYELPREDRQKVIGPANVALYKKQLLDAINLQSWNDLIAFEKSHPGSLALVPGPCQVCERTHEGCARPSNRPCRHMDLLRFSMEGIGIDGETLGKFELGLMPNWTGDGRLPQKITTVMGILSNDLIPMEDFKEAFPDAQKNFLNLSERMSLDPNVLSPEIKRQTSWLDEQVQQRKQKEELQARLEAERSEAMLPSQHLKDAPKPETELPTEHIGNQVSEVGMPNEHLHEEKKAVPTDGLAEEDEDAKYKWLGFKRSMDEVNRNFYNRPIPKFNVPDEEEIEEEAQTEAQEAQPIETVVEQIPLEPKTTEPDDEEDAGLNYSFKRPLEDEEDVQASDAVPKWKTNPALLPDEDEVEETEEGEQDTDLSTSQSKETADPMKSLLESLDIETLKTVLAAKLKDMPAAEGKPEEIIEEKTDNSKAIADELRLRIQEERKQRLEQERLKKEEEERVEREQKALEEKKKEEAREQLEAQIRERLLEEQRKKEEAEAAERARIEAEALAKREAEEAKKREEQKKLEEKKRLEAQKLPDASKVDNVLSAALSIAKQVSGEPSKNPETEKKEPEKKPVRHSYRWLNYKSELQEDDETLPDWKDKK